MANTEERLDKNAQLRDLLIDELSATEDQRKEFVNELARLLKDSDSQAINMKRLLIEERQSDNIAEIAAELMKNINPDRYRAKKAVCDNPSKDTVIEDEGFVSVDGEFEQGCQLLTMDILKEGDEDKPS